MKRQLGQYFTKNSEYILQGMEKFVRDKDVSDPFAGNKDLIVWAKKNGCRIAKGYDYDKRYVNNKDVFFNDSIRSPQKYKFICTNPPYLHKNKSDNQTKERFFSGKYSCFEDLYQISIYSMLNSEEGILVVPLNFLCAENSRKIRDIFFDRFEILKINIFTEQVFDDTTYNVVSFYYKRKKKPSNFIKLHALILPENKITDFTIERPHGWQLGGAFANKVRKTNNMLGIYRLTEDVIERGECEVKLALQNIKDIRSYKISEENKKAIGNNILFLRAVDSKNGKKIQLEDIRNYGVLGLVGKNTSRSMAHLIFGKEMPKNDQIVLMNKFNEEVNLNREKYSSYFLTNFRDNNRKRISFDFTYKLLNYLYVKDENEVKYSLF
jgi:hypothetical protein